MRILYVDDHTPFRAVVQRRFLAAHQVLPAATLEEARALMAENQFALALVEANLPDGDSAVFVGELREKQPDCVVLAACSSADESKRLVAAGAHDSVSKGEFSRLAQIVTRFVPDPEA